MTWSLDTEQEHLPVTDLEQLRGLLLRLQQESQHSPVIVMLNAPDGACLCIGLGHDLGTLSWIAPGGWPAKHVIGAEGAEGLLAYTCAGRYSEIPASQAVPIEQAISAALEFFESGEPSKALEWEDD